MSSNHLFMNLDSYKLFSYKIYLSIYLSIYQEDLILNKPQSLICHEKASNNVFLAYMWFG